MPFQRTRPRLPARYAPLVTPSVLSLLMTFIVSLISTLKGVGLAPDFIAVWSPAWGLSWLAAFPTLLLVLPVVRRIAGWVCQPAP